MVSSFISPTLNPDLGLGMQAPDEVEPLQLFPDASNQEVDGVIQAVYRQVLGNIHVMDSERLVAAEEQLRQGTLTVREFVRRVAKSQLYCDRFVAPCSQTRTIELNFKHLLGRSPSGYAELALHGQIYEQGGFEAEIDSYLDSGEYQSAYGENIVPYYRGYTTQTGGTLAAFADRLKRPRGSASSDIDAGQLGSRLSQLVQSQLPQFFVPLAVRAPSGMVPSLTLSQQSTSVSSGRSFPDVHNVEPSVLLGVKALQDSEPIQLWPDASDSEVDEVIQAVYRQVLGNAHVVESERLVSAEARLRNGDWSVREFVRQVAMSSLYARLFVEPCSRTRTIELNFKHLLGRAPSTYEEIARQGQIYEQGGFAHEIDSYLESDEYLAAYGENIVPYARGYETQVGQTVTAFTHWFPLSRGAASSDRGFAPQNRSQLNRFIMGNSPSLVAYVSGTSVPLIPYAYEKVEGGSTIPGPRPSSDSYAVNPGYSVPGFRQVETSALLGVRAFQDNEPLQLWPDASDAEVDGVIQAVYRQVLGNAHVMESERLVSAEARLRNGDWSVREFVRQVALSALYARLFVEPCSRTRTIELNFKHLLGRAPETYEEITRHGQIYDQGGFAGEIDSYLESDEYLATYGENIVPYARGYDTQVGQPLTTFTHWFPLSRGAVSSDRGLVPQNRSQLNRFIMGNSPSLIAPVSGVFTLQPVSSAPVDPNRAEIPLPGSLPESLPLTTDGPRYVQFYSGYQPFKDADPVELRVGSSEAEAEVVIRAIYRQVLGNAHVMESERLVALESRLKGGEISVREFVRLLAHSELYRSRFFDNCYRYRSIELNFKHLLGRAPDNFDEMRYHSAILDQEGYEADIDSYLDSDEYLDNFGDWMVPDYRGCETQPGQSMVGFTNMFQLLKSASGSDKDLATNQAARLTRSVIKGSPFGKSQPSSDPVSLAREALNLDSKGYAESSSPESLIRAALSVGVEGSAHVPLSSAADQELQQMIDAQAKELEHLKVQLADLQRFASMGEAVTNHIQFNGISGGAEIEVGVHGGVGLQVRADAQKREIESLKAQISQSRALASIGDAKLNKWRSRVFS